MENQEKSTAEKVETKYNQKSIWALGLGIVGILGFYLLSFVAIVVGILSIKEINKDKSKGIGLAIAGLVIGILGALANIGQHLIR